MHKLRALVKTCEQDLGTLHTEEMCSLGGWGRAWEVTPPAPHKTESEENLKGERTASKKTEEPSSEGSDLELDLEGVIDPDTDAPQETGDKNVERTTEGMKDQANDKSGCH